MERHHALALKPWLNPQERRPNLHFLTHYALYLNPIEGFLRKIHGRVTCNRSYRDYREFVEAIIRFFDSTPPRCK
ncbi:MAG: hypothetical protein OXI87_08005 [Albidovulum sp.]|nr:hypothetical protein [Albidovulum sp.]